MVPSRTQFSATPAGTVARIDRLCFTCPVFVVVYRGMRWALMHSFHDIHTLDLHGNLKKKETPPDGGRDVNVFDIEQGVGIGLFTKRRPGTHTVTDATVRHDDVWGERQPKYDWLTAHYFSDTDWASVDAAEPFYLFEPLESSEVGDYFDWPGLREIMHVNGTGVITKRDFLSIHFDAKEIWKTVMDFARMNERVARQHFNLPDDVRDWQFDWAQKDVADSGPSKHCIKPILYRPFDVRRIYYTGRTRGFIGWPVFDVMGHMLAGENLAIITARSNKFPEPDHFFASKTMVETKCGESSTQSATFPLYLYPGVGKSGGSMFHTWPEGKGGRRPNLDPGFVEAIEQATRLKFVSDGRGDLKPSGGGRPRRRAGVHLCRVPLPRVPPTF